MTKLLSLGVAIGISFSCVAAAQSMPVAPLEQAQTNLTIPVAGGCGPGFHRGPYGGCRRNGYYGGVYYGGAGGRAGGGGGGWARVGGGPPGWGHPRRSW